MTKKTLTREQIEKKLKELLLTAQHHKEGLDSTNTEYRKGSQAFYNKALVDIELHNLALRGLEADDAYELEAARARIAALEAEVKRLEAIIAPITGGEVDDLEGTDEQTDEISRATVFWETRGQIHEQSGSLSFNKIAAIFNAIVQMRVKERK
jgi:hypothetical protein